MSNVRIVPGQGVPCPRCDRATTIRQHVAITAKELAKPFYYRRWYICENRDCRTTMIMPEDCKVYPAGAAGASSASVASDLPWVPANRPTRLIRDFFRQFHKGEWA